MNSGVWGQLILWLCVCAEFAHRSPSIALQGDNGDREAQSGSFACVAQQEQCQALQKEPWCGPGKHLKRLQHC